MEPLDDESGHELDNYSQSQSDEEVEEEEAMKQCKMPAKGLYSVGRLDGNDDEDGFDSEDSLSQLCGELEDEKPATTDGLSSFIGLLEKKKYTTKKLPTLTNSYPKPQERVSPNHSNLSSS